MLICQRIKYRFSFPAALHQAALLQDPKLVGNGALGHVQKLRDVADAHLGFEEHIEDFDPGGIAKNLKSSARS